MTVRRLFALIPVLLVAALPSAAAGNPEEWIARARAYLGKEAALNSVRSLHFHGSFAGTEEVADPADPKKTVEQPVKVGIDIVFQQPMQQRQILRSEKIERTTALDGYDGWERVVDLSGQNATRLMLLDGPSIKRLRATTVENLSFYSAQGGSPRQVQLLDDVTVDGIDCVKLSFTHGDSIVFLRYFDKATGRLVKTEIEGGGEIREEGEMMVQGIRFPQKVVNKAANGRTTAITFDQVTINESFPAAIFTVPSLQAR